MHALAPGFYLDEETAEDAVRRRSTFNVIHDESMVKVDFIVRKDDPYREAEFGRRRLVSLGEDELTASAERSLAEASALHVPVIAAWEIEIKRRLIRPDGTPKLEVRGATASLVRYVVERGGQVMPLGLEHVATELDVSCPNRDPFDRVLLQQCQAEGLGLTTSDAQLRGHPLVLYVG